MNSVFNRSQVALAVMTAIGAAAVAIAPSDASAAKAPGKYVAGDFHNHTTCSDGSISMQKLVKKSTDTVDTPWGLDWFVQAGHGGNGNRNCTLTEDAALNTPVYTNAPATAVFPTNPQVGGPYTTWANSIGSTALKGNNAAATGNMWRWQSIKEYQYPLMEYLSKYQGVPLFIGLESVVAGHEHTSMSVVSGQMPASLDTSTLPTSAPYAPLGDAVALAKWSYCFDRGDTDKSRGAENQWDCSVTGSANAANPNWDATAFKILQPANTVGSGSGTVGHLKTLEALKWMKEFAPDASYYVPAHLERAGPFNPDSNNGFNIEHLRNFNNVAPRVAFGFESQPGHGASAERGEYRPLRNGFVGAPTNVDSVGGTTYGGTGIYAGLVGGVWDALLGEGRNWWFFASSDWHNRGGFSVDDRRSTQDFLPGEYQRNYTMVRNGADKLRPQTIVNGLRTGNNFAASGQLVDRLAFIACASYGGQRSDAAVQALAVTAAANNTDIDASGCATMGEKLVVRPGAEIVVSVVVRDPAGANYAPYSFANPSLAQINVTQPINQPVLDHIDLIRGLVTGLKAPGSPDYAGEWPRNTAWLKTDGSTATLADVPAAAKNTTAAVIRTFAASGGTASWTAVTSPVDGSQLLAMTYRIPAVSASQYVRLRGTNLPASVPYETDASGNPLPDFFTNATTSANLRIPCSVTGTNVPAAGVTWTQANGTIDGCPNHLAVPTTGAFAGQKMVSYDVAAWSDLWFYSNPIYVQVSGSSLVAGVQ